MHNLQLPIETNRKQHGVGINTDGSAAIDQSGWGFTVNQGGLLSFSWLFYVQATC